MWKTKKKKKELNSISHSPFFFNTTQHILKSAAQLRIVGGSQVQSWFSKWISQKVQVSGNIIKSNTIKGEG